MANATFSHKTVSLNNNLWPDGFCIFFIVKTSSKLIIKVTYRSDFPPPPMNDTLNHFDL